MSETEQESMSKVIYHFFDEKMQPIEKAKATYFFARKVDTETGALILEWNGLATPDMETTEEYTDENVKDT